jgi:uncharacterized protein (TIGR00661 family)
MKVLYAFQGTGNGHLTRAIEIIPHLKNLAEVDILMSGTQSDVRFPFDLKYKYYGFSFTFGIQGGVDIGKTIQRFKPGKLMQEIRNLPVEKYDLILNDFEPVSAWACKMKDKPCISLSHQTAVIHPDAPKPEKSDWVGSMVLKRYAPTSNGYGFHFKSYAQTIFTPIIRSFLKNQSIEDRSHITVYLPAYGDSNLFELLSKFPKVKWEVFSKHSSRNYSQNNVNFHRVSGEAFMQSMLQASGIICGAGFETPAEVLYLGKKLLVTPMKNQYEQHCNAAALVDLGVSSLRTLDRSSIPAIQEWLDSSKVIQMDYPDQTRQVLEKVLASS